jgi:hypothetical protein
MDAQDLKNLTDEQVKLYCNIQAQYAYFLVDENFEINIKAARDFMEEDFNEWTVAFSQIDYEDIPININENFGEYELNILNFRLQIGR